MFWDKNYYPLGIGICHSIQRTMRDRICIYHCGVNSLRPECHMETLIWVSIGWSNGLVTSGIKPLPEPMLTNHYWDSMAFTWEQFQSQCLSYNSVWWHWKSYFFVGFACHYHHWIFLASNNILGFQQLISPHLIDLRKYKIFITQFTYQHPLCAKLPWNDSYWIEFSFPTYC